MKIIFFGTPKFVLPVVENTPNLFAVVTQSPKPNKSPVNKWADKNNIEIIYKLNDIPKADLGIVAAYGKIIPENIINKFKYGIINIHPSLLPKYRGATPVQNAILNGDKFTGVSFIKMDKEMDHGPILHCIEVAILDTDNTEILLNKLFKKSANILPELISDYTNNKIIPKIQNHTKATFVTPLAKQDGFINSKNINNALAGDNYKNIHNKIRAMYPWPCGWTHININNKIKIIKLIKSHITNGKLILDEVQLEGKNPVTWKQFKEGYPRFSFFS